MPGWDQFSPRSWLRERFDAPVWADNHVHLMALGEWHADPEPRRDMLFIEVGMDVGAGLIVDGRVLRGQRGGAGAIGHLRVSDDPTPCRCGRSGCLEVSAGGWSLLAQATSRADESPSLRTVLRSRPLTLVDLGRAARDGDPIVRELFQTAAVEISKVVADLVNFSNPGEVVVGGGVLIAGESFVESFLATMDAHIRARGTQLVTEQLIVRSSLVREGYGIRGAGRLALDSILNPTSLARWLPSRTPVVHGAELQGIAS
jgi:predicted NBD/HSP70 family sugar kinase